MGSSRDYAVLQVLPRLETGGVEQVVVELTEAVARTGARALVAAAPGRLVTQVERAGGHFRALPFDTRNPLSRRANTSRLIKLIKAERISLIHAHSRAPAFAAREAAAACAIPFVTTYHGAYSEAGKLKRAYNSVMASGQRVLAVSEYIAGLVRERHDVGPDRLRVVPGGVDPARFDPEAIHETRMIRFAQEWRLIDGAPTIMLPARLTAWKGQGVMIAALAKLRHRDALLLLVGGAQGRTDYVRSLWQAADRVGVAGRIRMIGDCTDMPAAYKLADVVVNASTDPEAFGRTIVEAQAMRRLVIATDHGAARETIREGETGWRTKPGDAEALAATIDRALDLDIPARMAMGAAARDFVATHYSIAAMQAGNLAAYHELLG
jgi:glycosyltransferase involved in cell wall biosynthesis